MPIRNSETGFGSFDNSDGKSEQPRDPRKRNLPAPVNLQSPSVLRQQESRTQTNPDSAVADPRSDFQIIRERIAAAKNNINQAIADGRIVAGQFCLLADLDKITGLSNIDATSRLLYSLNEEGFRPVAEKPTNIVIGYKYKPKEIQTATSAKNQNEAQLQAGQETQAIGMAKKKAVEKEVKKQPNLGQTSSQPVATQEEVRGSEDQLRSLKQKEKETYDFIMRKNQPGVSTYIDNLSFPKGYGFGRKHNLISLLCNMGLMKDDGNYYYTILQ